MFEGSAAGVEGGRIENVESINCQGCFSGYPANGLFQTGNTCASPVCIGDDPPRGGKTMVNLWAAGDNAKVSVYSDDITVEDSYYYDPCPDDEGRIYWESRNGEIFNLPLGITELESFTPRTPYTIEFDWDTAACGFSPPDIDCNSDEWVDEEIGSTVTQYNINLVENVALIQRMVGSCWHYEDLPSIVPAPEGWSSTDARWEEIVEYKFSYELNSDDITWDAWVTAVEDWYTYLVEDYHQNAAEKFSAFIMNWECLTTN